MLGSASRRYRAPLLLALVFAAIATAAYVDRTHKQTNINRAQDAEWYCSHFRAHCGRGSSAEIERRWERRERGYAAALILIGAASIVAAVRVAPRRRE